MDEKTAVAPVGEPDETENDAGVRPYCIHGIAADPLDPETVKKAMAGDDEAFSALFISTYRYVYSVAKTYLNNDEDIYDAIQDTYVKVYANIGRLKSVESFHSWIGRIAENSAKDITTKNGAPKTELTEETEEYLSSDNEVRSAEREVAMDITAVFAQLPAADAELLTYVYYDGFKVADIARMQGVPATTVYSRLNAAKRRLKELLKIRGIDKPVYGGDLVTLITTTIRNAIGTNLLSAAVAEEILHSVTGKKSKAAVVISKVTRKQRNAAVLRIASLIVLLAILASLVTLGVYFAVRALTRRGGSVTAGVSTEVGGTESVGGDQSGHDASNDGSVPGLGSTGSNTLGGNGQGGSPTQPGGTANGNTDNTASEGNTSTGTSGEVGGTGDPGAGGTSSVTSPSSTGGTTTSGSKPSTSSSAASSSQPSGSAPSSSSSGTSSAASSQPTTPGAETMWSTREVSGGVEITGIAEEVSSGNYTIPSTINGKTVVGIGDKAFYYESGIKSITLPDTLTYIGENAFAYAGGITSIVIPSGVTAIKLNAFTECRSLADVYIKSKNISIDTNAFSTMYQRDVTLTIHAPASVMNSMQAKLRWDAEYEEWNG